MINNSLPVSMTYDPCGASAGFRDFQDVMNFVLIIGNIVSSLFGGLVAYCATQLYRRTENSTHLFILSMTCGDILITVFGAQEEVVFRVLNYHTYLCTPLKRIPQRFALAVLGLSLVMLNVDKLLYFGRSLQYNRIMSKDRARICCAAIFVVSLGFVLLGWICGWLRTDENCIQQVDRAYYLVYVIVFCIIPVTSSMILSVFLYRVRRSRLKPVVTFGSNVGRAQTKPKLRSIMFIFVTTAWTAFSLLPYRTFNIFWPTSAVDNYPCDTWLVLDYINWMLLYLQFANSIVDPWITAFVYAPYSNAIKKLLEKCLTRCGVRRRRFNDHETFL